MDVPNSTIRSRSPRTGDRVEEPAIGRSNGQEMLGVSAICDPVVSVLLCDQLGGCFFHRLTGLLELGHHFGHVVVICCICVLVKLVESLCDATAGNQSHENPFPDGRSRIGLDRPAVGIDWGELDVIAKPRQTLYSFPPINV